MPGDAKLKPRPLPTLLAIPIVQFNKSRPRRAIQSKNAKLNPDDHAIPENPHKQAVEMSVDALRAVIAQTLKFLNCKPSYGADLIQWLHDLNGALDVVEFAITDGGFYDYEINIDTEGPSDMDEVLCLVPELDSEDFPDKCVLEMLSFWVDEITRRGWELFHILISSVDVIDARKAFLDVKSLRYPI